MIDIDAHPRQLPGRDRLLPGIDIAETVDLTGLANGFHTIGVLAALRGAASPADDETTLRVRTPSGGLHVWYRALGGHRWQCSSGSGGGRALAWQVDVRAHGGYIVAPGTVTEAGTYEAVGTAREPAPLPAWLARELQRTGHLPPVDVPTPRPVPPRARQAVLAASGGRSAGSRALAPLLAEVAACAAVPEGAGFTEKLNRAAYTAAWARRRGAAGRGRGRAGPAGGGRTGAPRAGAALRRRHPRRAERGPHPPADPGRPPVKSGHDNALFDAGEVAAQILAQSVPQARPEAHSRPQAPAQAHSVHSAPEGRMKGHNGSRAAAEATPDGLLPDTLSDRGNAKLFVSLYANDYRHVPGLGWFRWDSTRWQIDEDDTVLWAAGDLAESLATTDPRGVHSTTALQQHRFYAR